MTTGASESSFPREQTLHWCEDGREHQARVAVRRWKRTPHDRLYVCEILPDGSEVELGNYDLNLRRWFTARGSALPSRARGEAIKAFVMACVHECAGQGSQS